MNDRDENDAVATAMRMVRADWHNSPERFVDLPPPAQEALRFWVRLALKPATSFEREHGRYHSYNLKHFAEQALGFYIGNGAMKGAMLAEGYREYRAWGDRENPEINWTFKAQRRCPHRVSWDDYTLRFTCPMRGRYTNYSSSASFPSLCQASADELAEFELLRLRAMRRAS